MSGRKARHFIILNAEKVCLSNQGRSEVWVWQSPHTTSGQIKTADVYADGLNFHWKEHSGQVWAGERASSTGSVIIKAQEAEQPQAAAAVVEEHLSSFNHQCDLHTHYTAVCVILLSTKYDTASRQSDGVTENINTHCFL